MGSIPLLQRRMLCSVLPQKEQDGGIFKSDAVNEFIQLTISYSVIQFFSNTILILLSIKKCLIIFSYKI